QGINRMHSRRKAISAFSKDQFSCFTSRFRKIMHCKTPIFYFSKCLRVQIMKLKITIILILLVTLTGCTSLKSSARKLPRCNGQNARILNQGKWNLNHHNILHNTAVKPITTPIILNTQENEAPKAHIELPASSVDTIKHQTPSYKNAEITHEK
ncbi:MAG: hypothetical protein PV354_04895, partial [Bartonella sp.]|nr:hypothetical protein [Bartonella sp.]